MTWTLIKAVIKARREGLLHLVPANEATRLDCLKAECAKCCRVLGTPVVTPAEAENIAPEALRKDKHGRIFTRSKNSVCCLLKDGLCSIYPDRPRGCREYPWYNVAGRLYFDAGCPGIKHDLDERPAAGDIMPFEDFFPLAPRFILWIVKKVCVKK
ncbi:MAG TPA: YkgJ family cysteine cluster protein [Planctomycetes bacterium]|nr:YkgJ family cysteine cluster protein [Planctomycetota bacterium]